MVALNQLIKKYYLPLLLSLVLIGYQVVRVTVFASVYGGFEHDGGWMLTISRSLAERGSYTTMVSTIPDPAVLGAINVDDKFDIQAPDGRIWFFTGNGIGPASIIPDALVIKLFGTSFWALKAGPLIFYTLFLILATYIVYRLAGVWAIILFHGYLFCYPHISIFLGYEAMGEVPGMVYILAAYLTFVWALGKIERISPHPASPPGERSSASPLAATEGRLEGGRAEQKPNSPAAVGPFFVAGLMVSLTLNAKLITLWSLSGIVIWAGLLWLRRKVQFRELLALGSGTALLVILWELVHLVVLTWLTNFELYQQNLWQRIKFILDDGSGVGLQIHFGPIFWWDKFFLLREVGHPAYWVTGLIFLGLVTGGLSLLWWWRTDLTKQSLWACMWFGWLANTAWFVSLAKTGWPRHIWFGLVLAMMLLSVIGVQWLWQGGRLFRQASDAGRWNCRRLAFLLPASSGVLLVGLILWGFSQQPHVWGFYLPDEIVPYWREKQLTNKYDASLPWVIIPRAAQTEVVRYIKQLPAEAHVYYPSGHKNAEIPAQTGRLHYPLHRRPLMKPHSQDIALIGPSLISPWLDPVRRADLTRLIRQNCPQPILENEFYMICPLPAEAEVELNF